MRQHEAKQTVDVFLNLKLQWMCTALCTAVLCLKSEAKQLNSMTGTSGARSPEIGDVSLLISMVVCFIYSMVNAISLIKQRKCYSISVDPLCFKKYWLVVTIATSDVWKSSLVWRVWRAKPRSLANWIHRGKQYGARPETPNTYKATPVPRRATSTFPTAA